MHVWLLLPVLLVNIICGRYVECPVCSRVRRLEAQLQRAEQCPCVKPPGSSECLAYDSRLQAANIDEALYTFPDLSTPRETGQTLLSTDEEHPATPLFKSAFSFSVTHKKTYQSRTEYKCDTDECQACKRMITRAFINANMERSGDGTIAGAQSSNDDIDQSLCLKDKFATNQDNRYATNITIRHLPAQLEEVVMLLTPKVRKRNAKTEVKPKCKLLGIATTIGCNYKRGEEIAHGWSGLCNLCWQWRKLPADYFPVLLNEVTCDSSDEGCLSGFGNCRPIMRSITVLRNVASQKSPRWVQESINTIAACECQVELGTPIHSLVLR